MLTFMKDYKNDDGLRQSFDTLAKNTFGISFEDWYQNGCWDDNYITYSFHDAGKIVANASANRMTLKIEGMETPVSAIQIGTVMTDPTYRRKGLAYALMQKIFDDFDQETSIYYLAADRDAMPLYEKCGFSEIAETCYHYVIPSVIPSVKGENEPSASVSISANQQLAPAKIVIPADEVLSLKKTNLSLDAFLHWKRSAMPKGCAFDVVGDAHIAAFYWFHGFNDMLYTLGDDCLVIAELSEDGRKMTLYDYYVVDTRALNKQELASVRLESVLKAITRIPDNRIEEVVFAFDVTGMQLTLPLISYTKIKSGWMTRSLENVRFPETFCYPKLTQA